MSFLAVFILLGVGVDDMFILVDSFNRASRFKDLPRQAGAALGEIGPSILFTSVTDFLAFVIGSTGNHRAQ